MKIIRSLDGIGYDQIFDSFKEAFADYEMQLTKDQLIGMLVRRGFIEKLSFGCFVDDRLIAFTLNGIGNFNGIVTAYDTGTGTIKDYRGKGIATDIFNYSIPFLKDSGVKQYLLEVLQHNTKAVSVYSKLGFEVIREFNYFGQSTELLNDKSNKVKSDIKYNKSNLDEVSKCTDFWDFHPSWQNDFNAISRSIATFDFLGAYFENNIIGYCILESATGDISQIAVSKQYRNKGIGTTLVSKILKLNNYHSVKAINTDVDCESMTSFFKKLNFEHQGKQFEMIKPF